MTLIRLMKTQVYVFPDAVKNPAHNYLDIQKIRFSDTPYKKLCPEATSEFKKDIFTHFIDMYYKNRSLIIQLPRYKIQSIDNNKLILQTSDILSQYLIGPLEEHIIQSVHKYSEKWFNGKRFTLNKILSSIVSPLTKENFLLKVSLSKNTMFFNQYKNIIHKEDISDNIEIIPLIKIANLQFLQNKFSYNIVLEQAKVFIDERLIEYSIIDDPDGKISESISCDTNDEYYQESINSSKREFF